MTVNESASKSIVNGDKIGFFFDAGASIEFGISSMKQMTKGFAKEIEYNGRKEARLFRLIYNSLEKMHLKTSTTTIIAAISTNTYRNKIRYLLAFTNISSGN